MSELAHESGPGPNLSLNTVRPRVETGRMLKDLIIPDPDTVLVQPT